MATLTMDLSANLRQLVDDRLESVERFLLGRGMARSERLEVVAGLENQIFEMLASRGIDEPSRRDVLDVLSRLDPPEAYGREAGPSHERRRTELPSRPAPQSEASVCWVSICGLSIGATILLLGLICVVLGFLEIEETLLLAGVPGSIVSLACGIVGIVRIRSSQGRLRGLPVAAVSTFLYPFAAITLFTVYLCLEAEVLLVFMSFLGMVSAMAWMHVGAYRLIAIGYRRSRSLRREDD